MSTGGPPQRPGWTRPEIRARRRRKGRQRLAAVLVILMGAGVGAAVIRERRKPPPPPPPPPPLTPLTIPEGLRREDIAALITEKTRLSGDEYLALTAAGPRGQALAKTAKPASLEGFLFPATYSIGTDTTIPFLIDQQVRAFETNIGTVNLRLAASRNLTRFDVVTIASMIEREVQVPQERAVVAGVIYNRLRRQMRLDIDATVQYAVGAWRPLTGADLRSDSPYNTRRFPGLPPGPISNPGLASLKAAARPAQHDYLYYVARDDGSGRHYFARTIDEFQQLQAQARQNATP